MRRDVQNFVASCQVCQQMKDLLKYPAGLLQPLPVSDMVFEEITVDFITCLPSSKGKATIMTVVDRLSKYAHFIALPSTFTTQTVVVAFVSEVIRLHGHPKVIVTDRDPRFMNYFWKEIHRLQGTTLSMSTTYHPQTDGQSEALNRCVEQYLRCFVADSPHEWLPLLPWAECWYNTAYQTSAGMTPFQALYGREPPTLARYALGSSSNDLIEQFMLQRDEVMDILKHNLTKAQQKMKEFADKKCTFVEFTEREWVFVKLKPYRQHSLRLQRHQKLGRRYFRPYKILKRIGEVAYKLDLPEEARIHPIFHVSMLQKCVGTPENQVTPFQLKEIPQSNLEDKVSSEDGGIVITGGDVGLHEDNVYGLGGLPRRSKRGKRLSQRLVDYVLDAG